MGGLRSEDSKANMGAGHVSCRREGRLAGQAGLGEGQRGAGDPGPLTHPPTATHHHPPHPCTCPTHPYLAKTPLASPTTGHPTAPPPHRHTAYSTHYTCPALTKTP
ncbi:hypothetical protein E2C01_042461 [Portunus trituberculatus]|uniref:Uncharacterized protein n=1 Tax=Portunus trituberculatus TaxID=210409 RepID=A0A5B7FLX4_PORTR|nr:hypothetical protein [Portunus trituberculatus]